MPVEIEVDATLAAADAALEAQAEAKQEARNRRRAESRAPYIGLSALGDECERRTYYRAHGPAVAERMDATSIKRIQDGYASEDVMAKRLRMVPGVTLVTVNPDDGRQITVEGLGGRLRGALDGVAMGLLHLPATTWAVWEAKAVGQKSFDKLAKLKAERGDDAALSEWNANYRVQAQGYMGYTGLQHHFMTVSTPGVRDWIALKTTFQPVEFEALEAKAERILSARVPLARVSNNPTFYLCKMCQFKEICHGSGA